jgi:hypothetical protein
LLVIPYPQTHHRVKDERWRRLRLASEHDGARARRAAP